MAAEGVDRSDLDLALRAHALRELAIRVEEDWPVLEPATIAIADAMRKSFFSAFVSVVYRNRGEAEVNGVTITTLGEPNPADCDLFLAERLEKAAYLCAFAAYPDHKRFEGEWKKTTLLHERMRSVADGIYREGMPLTPRDVREIFGGCDNNTLNEYARFAGVATPSRGQRGHKFTIMDVRRIADAILHHAASADLRLNAENAKRQIGV